MIRYLADKTIPTSIDPATQHTIYLAIASGIIAGVVVYCWKKSFGTIMIAAGVMMGMAYLWSQA